MANVVGLFAIPNCPRLLRRRAPARRTAGDEPSRPHLRQTGSPKNETGVPRERGLRSYHERYLLLSRRVVLCPGEILFPYVNFKTQNVIS